MGRFLFAAALAAALACPAAPASALPVFAHRYGFSCQACHTTVPHLNAFGERFLRSGFRLPGPKHGVEPVAVKVNLAYSSDKDPSGLPKAIVDEVELLTAGAIGPRVSYFLEQYAVDGGTPGKTRDAWVQYRAPGDRWNLRAGRFTLPLPVDPETQRDTLAHYAVLEPLFDDRTGLDLSFSGDRGFTAHVAALAEGGLATHAYVSQTFGNGFSLHAYAFNSQQRSEHGFAAGQTLGKLQLLGLVQNGGAFLETHYTFSGRFMAVARSERGQGVFSLIFRPRSNMRLTLEDDVTDHHALGVGWLLAY